MIQGGGFHVDMILKTVHSPIKIESNNGLLNVRGTVAMARTSDPNSATSGLYLKALHDMVRRGTWIQHTADLPIVGGLRGRYLGADGQWPRAPWAVARLSGVPLVPILVLTSRDWTFKIVVGDPIYVAADGPAETAMEDALQTYFDFVSPRALEAPWNLPWNIKLRAPEKMF